MSTYALQIANACFDRLKVLPGFTTYFRTPKKQVQPRELPMLCVFILREQRVPEGQANQGPLSFFCSLHIAVSGTTKMIDELDQLTDLEDKMNSIDNALFTDPEFVRLIEGVASIDRKLFFMKEGETSLAEIQIEYVFQYRYTFDPVVPDDFKSLHIESRFPTADTDPEEVQQVSAAIDIEF